MPNWNQINAKAIELQILNSQQQEKILENQDRMIALLEKIEAHFSNGFRSEIKKHVEDQVKVVSEKVESIDEKVEDLKGSAWKMAWLFGGITLFTIANAIATIISLWANGFIFNGSKGG